MHLFTAVAAVIGLVALFEIAPPGHPEQCSVYTDAIGRRK
jgi:hypothetical protein